ncbi:hypothetical protein KGP36_02805 [Patescibacteria group bacterium]|nr:hypothetical protein [Patescibacteria group bacterium]
MFPHEINTVDELLKQWDAGETIWTINLGGLGPGYDQAIQVSAIEFARANQKDPMPRTDDPKVDYEAWDKRCTETLHAFDEKLGGLSGAMFGAAKWLSWQWCHNGGPKHLIDRAKEQGKDDQIMQCSNIWPKVPSPQEALDAGVAAGKASLAKE